MQERDKAERATRPPSPEVKRHKGALADLPDPAVRRRVMGRRFFRITRGWSEEQWGEAVARLTAGMVGFPRPPRLSAGLPTDPRRRMGGDIRAVHKKTPRRINRCGLIQIHFL